MTQAISDVDHLMIVLRQRLAERIKRAAAGKTDRQSSGQSPTSDAIGQTLSLEGVDDSTIKRALVHRLLADQFGSEVVNEPKFQGLVDQVEGALGENPTTNHLLNHVITQLKADAQGPTASPGSNVLGQT